MNWPIFFKVNEQQYKHSGTFASRNYEHWTFLPQKSENVQPHSSNFIENATPL